MDSRAILALQELAEAVERIAHNLRVSLRSIDRQMQLRDNRDRVQKKEGEFDGKA